MGGQLGGVGACAPEAGHTSSERSPTRRGGCQARPFAGGDGRHRAGAGFGLRVRAATGQPCPSLVVGYSAGVPRLLSTL